LLGLRPTHGRISLEDCLDLSPSFDSCGWFTRDVSTFVRVADVLLGEDDKPLPQRVRLLSPDDVWGLLQPEATEAFAAPRQRVADTLGAATHVNVVLDSFDAMYWHFRHLQGREAWRTDGDFIARFLPPLGPGVAERFAWSSQVSDEKVSQATAFRVRFCAHLAALLGDDGVLVMPTMPDVAPLRSDSEAALEDYRNASIRMLCISGLAGFPQLSLPLATRLGAPLGLSILGPAGSDRSLVRLAQQLFV
jgi:amidase